MHKTIFFPLVLNLQHFNDGGDGGTGADGATGETATAAVSQQGVNADNGNVQAANAQTDLDKEFEELIKGKYKEYYDARVKETVQKRLKSVKDTADRYTALTPTLDLLAKKYGVNAEDVEALNKAIEDDDAYYEEEAMEKGISVEQLKSIKRIERENAALKKQMNENNARERAAQKYAAWMEQAQETTELYPSFNLESELKTNESFVNLLNSKVDVRTAYEVTHRDEIITGAMKVATQKAREQIANDVAANNARPLENGTRSTSLAKSDVSQLSYDEIDEINRKVLRGERYKY